MVLRSAFAGLDTAALRKARGAFFTPDALARYITDWAVRSVEDRILEPSCGEAAFLLAAVGRLAALEATSTGQTLLPHLDGVELHADSAQAARDLLTAAGVEATVTVGDFFDVKPGAESQNLQWRAVLAESEGIHQLYRSWSEDPPPPTTDR